MNKLFLLVFGSIILLGCKKSTLSDFSIHGFYRTEQIATVGPPVMYVRNAIITDTGIINNYLRSKNFFNRFTYNSIESAPDSLLLAEFLNNASVKYIRGGWPAFRTGIKNALSGSDLAIQSNDTFTLILDPYPGFRVRCDTLGSIIQKYPGLIFLNIFNGGSGQMAIAKLVDQILLSFENGQLIYHAANYSLSSTAAHGSCTSTGNTYISNIIPDDIETKLLVYDTIVYQAKKIRMVRY